MADSFDTSIPVLSEVVTHGNPALARRAPPFAPDAEASLVPPPVAPVLTPEPLREPLRESSPDSLPELTEVVPELTEVAPEVTAEAAAAPQAEHEAPLQTTPQAHLAQAEPHDTHDHAAPSYAFDERAAHADAALLPSHVVEEPVPARFVETPSQVHTHTPAESAPHFNEPERHAQPQQVETTHTAAAAQPQPQPHSLDADVIAERLRGRFASYLTGEGRELIEARCRDALNDHTIWLVSQITREVALALETQMTGWVRDAVSEELTRRSNDA